MTKDQALNKVLQELEEMTPDELREVLSNHEDLGFRAALAEVEEFLAELFKEEIILDNIK